jgi:DNA-binding MarR family transcriptional regulator
MTERKPRPSSSTGNGESAHAQFELTCNASAIRRAARRVARLYDECLAPTGVRGTQFAVLATVDQFQTVRIAKLARALAMDRTTLGHNLRPLLREQWLTMEVGEDRRARVVQLTPAGKRKVKECARAWNRAQALFEEKFGSDQAADMRRIMALVERLEL